MGVYIYQSGTEKELKNAYIGEYVVPKIYDFTQSDGGWTASSGTSRGSSGFYRSGTWSDGAIIAPSEIFSNTPKKIIISYNKVNASSGTGIFNDPSGTSHYMRVPYNPSQLNTIELYDGTSHYVSLGSNPTGNITWTMEIDSSTANRTVTHKIGTLSDVTDTYGIVKACWQDQQFGIRIVNRQGSTGSMYITGVTVEYE